MRRKLKKCLCVLTAAAVMLGGLQVPAVVKAQGSVQPVKSGRAAQSGGVTVYDRDTFMAALNRKESLIIVSNLITIGSEADTDGRMLPVKIPGGTTIRGAGSESQLNARCPIQLEGDGVCFQNIELTFESSNALGSVPHREIFLAGHSLTLDNVSTYLEGGGGEFGGLGGYEKELLPTVYAGAYTGSSVGSNASLTVTNSNSETMFQGIYMGHGTGIDKKVPYQGNAELNLDAKVKVREGIDTSQNAKAEINISGTEGQAASTVEFYGNENTTLTVSRVSVEKAMLGHIGNVILKEKACLAPLTDLKNVSLSGGACLDYNNMKEAVIAGSFTGETNASGERGILVLHPEGTLHINGQITGTTQFQTCQRLFPGTLFVGRPYIVTRPGNGSAQSFVLPQTKIDARYDLSYTDGKWSVTGDPVFNDKIGWMEILSVPSKVDLRKILQKNENSDEIPDENIYFEIKWYKENGDLFTPEEIITYGGFYTWAYVVGIRTDYWESDSPDDLGVTDWGGSVSLLGSEENPDKYYLKASDLTKVGNYTFLFCSEEIENDAQPKTVQEVKTLKNKIIAECRVDFYNKDAENPDSPEHKHAYQSSITKRPACTEEGERTFTCECGHTYTETIAAAGHTEVADPEVSPTETEDGKTEGSHCSVCGEILKTQEIIHTYESSVTEEATCTEKGTRTFTCKICKDAYTEEIPAKGHTVVTDPRIEPTEETPGKTEGSHCSVCEKVLVKQEDIPATGKPTEPENPGDKPTEPGNPDKPTTPDKPTEPENPDIPEQPSTPPAHAHAYQESVTKAPTCTAPGIKTYVCDCGDTYTEEIPASAHQYTEKRIPATVNSAGKVQQICSICSAVREVAVIDGIQGISLSRTEYVYNGKAKKPSVTVKDSKGRPLAQGADYQISYSKGRINPGVYTVTVKLCGNYNGRMTGTFTIKPRKTVLKKVTPKSKGMQVTWRKEISKADGYQIQYSTEKSFKASASKLAAAKKYAVGKKITKLKPRKKYYVRIRTYKTVRVNGKSKKLYSDWSDTKTVRTK